MPGHDPSPVLDRTDQPRDAQSRLIADALAEDIGSGDVTVASVLDDPARARPAVARLIAKAAGTVSGLGAARAVYEALDPAGCIAFEPAVLNGARVAPGEVVAVVRGTAAQLLTGERTALNFLGRLSGIATMAARFVDLVEGLPVQICDTRKTTPGYRLLEKQATAHGGAHNHRVGLYDQVLIKENYLHAAGLSVAEAVARSRAQLTAMGREGTPVGAEAENLDELDQALAAGADLVLLDEFSLADTAEAVRRRDAHVAAGGGGGRRPQLEASGRINLANVRAHAETGVDRISVGALTHSAPVLDLSCLFDWTRRAD